MMASTPTSQKRKADLKVVILGAASIGKTTLIHRYIEGKFQDTISTIGASFYLKQWGRYNVAVWDTAGEERFSGLSSFYCRGAGAAILAFDLTNEDSFHALRARFLPLLQYAEDGCLIVVVGTKMDLLASNPRMTSQDDAFHLAKELNNRSFTKLPYFETSSVTGQNVDQVFEYIFNQCLPKNEQISRQKRDSSVVDLAAPKRVPPEGKASGCC